MITQRNGFMEQLASELGRVTNITVGETNYICRKCGGVNDTPATVCSDCINEWYERQSQQTTEIEVV